MHTTDEQAWDRDDLFEEITIANVEDHRADRPGAIVELFIRHPNLSERVSVGTIGVSISLDSIVETMQAIIPDIFRALEIRVPEAGRSPLPPALFWRSLHSAGVVVEIVVSDSAVRR